MTSGTSGPSAMLLSTKDTNTEFLLQVTLDDDDNDDVIHLPGCGPQWAVSSVFPPGSGRVFGCHAKSLSGNRKPPADHQVLLLSDFSPVWVRYSHRTKLLHTSLLPPHAQPLHHASACLWGTRWIVLFYSVWLTKHCSVPAAFWSSLSESENNVLFFLALVSALFLRFRVRRTPSTCISCLLSKIRVWEHWSPTLLQQSFMLSVLYRYFLWFSDLSALCYYLL